MVTLASVHVGEQGLVVGACEWRLFMADQEKSGEPNAWLPQEWVLSAAALSLIHSSHFRVSGIRMLHRGYKPFHLIFSVQLCLPKTKDGHSSPWGASETKAPLGRRSHDGRIEWHTVHSGSTDPHLHQVWESPQDGFLNLNLIQF